MNTRRLFFWMQEEDKEQDDENCKKINEALNGAAEPVASTNNRP